MNAALGRSWACCVVLAASASLALPGSGALAASGTETLVCSTRALAPPPGAGASLRVVSLEVDGLGCATARSLARHVAFLLGRGASLSFRGASAISISEQSCGGCVSKTEVSIAYPRGTVRLSLSGPRSAPGGSSGVVTA